MISTFPEFKKLSLSDYKELNNFIKNYPPYSDFNLVSLWSYDVNKEIIISKLNNNLIIRFTDYINSKPFYSFLGKNKLISTIQMLMDCAVKENISPTLKLVPEAVIKSQLNLGKYFHIEEDRDNFDYISLLTALSSLKGEKYNRKHRLVKKFQRENPGHKAVSLDIKNKRIRSQIQEVFFIWEKSRKKQRKDTKHELIALNKLLDNSSFFNLFCIGLYNRDKLLGFSISEIIQQNYAIGHFMKADSNYRGIFEVLYNYTAQHLLSKGAQFINLEQDMGIKGLRFAKSSWNPVHYLKKYKISPKI